MRLLLAALLLSSPLAAADPLPRSPFFASLSLGAGAGGWRVDGRQQAWSSLPGITSPFAFALSLRGGLSLTERWLLGLELVGIGSWGGGVVPLEFGATTVERRAALNQFGPCVSFFPLSRGPYLRLGLGLSDAFEEFHGSGRDETVRSLGLGVDGAAGWAFPVAEHVVLSAELAGLYGAATGTPARAAAWALLVGLEWQ